MSELACANDGQADSLVLLLFGTVYNQTCHPQTALPVADAGATKACVAFVTVSPFEVIVALGSKILVNLALAPQNHTLMVDEGVMSAVKTLLGRLPCLGEALTVLSQLSTSAEVAPAMVDCGVVGMLEGVLDHGEGQLELDIQRDVALVFRNLTCSSVARAAIICSEGVLKFAFKLVDSVSDQDILGTEYGLRKGHSHTTPTHLLWRARNVSTL